MFPTFQSSKLLKNDNELTVNCNSETKAWAKVSSSPSTYIGLRLFKPDFDSGQWNCQSHFSFTIDELTCFATCLGLGDKAAVEVAGLGQNVPQDFNRFLESALCCGKDNDDTSCSVSSFVGKITTARKNTVKNAAIGIKPGTSSQTAKRRTVQAASSTKVVNSGDEHTIISQHQADIHNHGNEDKRFESGCDVGYRVQTQMDMGQAVEVDDKELDFTSLHEQVQILWWLWRKRINWKRISQVQRARFVWRFHRLFAYNIDFITQISISIQIYMCVWLCVVWFQFFTCYSSCRTVFFCVFNTFFLAFCFFAKTLWNKSVTIFLNNTVLGHCSQWTSCFFFS